VGGEEGEVVALGLEELGTLLVRLGLLLARAVEDVLGLQEDKPGSKKKKKKKKKKTSTGGSKRTSERVNRVHQQRSHCQKQRTNNTTVV